MASDTDQIVACRDVLTLCNGYGCAFEHDYAFCCMLEKGHEGLHYDEFKHEGRSVVIMWGVVGKEIDNGL